MSVHVANQIIKKDRTKWIKDPSRKNAWMLYGEGLSQREIASKCDHKQGWVSKLIPENKISEEIAQDKKPCPMGLFPDFEMGKVRYGCLYRVDRSRIA